MSAVLQLPKPSEITYEVVRISPTVAERWLGRNSQNRNIRHGWVSDLARMMVDGEWLLNGEAIKFAHDGVLLDGQHRLHAIVQSGKTVPMLVVRGLPANAQDTMDTGRARNAAHMLQIKGYPNATNLAATARIVLIYRDGVRESINSCKVSNRRIEEFARGNTMLAYASSQSSWISRSFRVRPALIGAAMYILMGIDADAAQEFFDRCADGVGLAAGSPILALRARVAANREERVNNPAEGDLSLIFRTWNAWRQKKSTSQIRVYVNGELIPCPEPK